MKLELAQAIEAEAWRAGFSGSEVEIIEDYSGRGMYGRETAALRFESVGSALAVMLSVEVPEDLEPPDGFRTDNMGLGIVVY